jgi:nicotinate dehydrogenase subunit B
LTENIYNLEYEIENKRGRSTFVEPTFRTIYLRGPGSVQSHFATESFIDELAYFAQVDPIQLRLEHLPDRDRQVLEAATNLAGWKQRLYPRLRPASGRLQRGRGFAYARYGVTDTLVAMVADVAVDSETGEVHVERVFVAHDCGFMVNPDGVLNQIQGNVIQGVSRSLLEEVHYSPARITSVDWSAYPVIRFQQVPQIEIELLQRPDMPPSVVGEVSSIPCPAAIANAIFDATGKRLRTVPFTPERVRGARSVYEISKAAKEGRTLTPFISQYVEVGTG